MDKLIEKRANAGVLQKRKQSSNSAGTIRSLNIRPYSQLNINIQIFAWAFGILTWTSCYKDGIYCLVHVQLCLCIPIMCHRLSLGSLTSSCIMRGRFTISYEISDLFYACPTISYDLN